MYGYTTTNMPVYETQSSYYSPSRLTPDNCLSDGLDNTSTNSSDISINYSLNQSSNLSLDHHQKQMYLNDSGVYTQHYSNNELLESRQSKKCSLKYFSIEAILAKPYQQPTINTEVKPKRNNKRQANETLPSKSDSKRIRTIFSQEQLDALEIEFTKQQYMVGNERTFLAKSLGLTESQVKIWFQNRRIKWRKNSEGSLVSHDGEADESASFSP